MVSKEAYPGYDEFFADVAATWRKAIRAFYDAGCRYLQLDDTAWAMICDPKEREGSQSARRRSRQPAGDLCARDQRGARRQAGRHGDHHAFLPRQFPLHLHRLGRLRICRRASARRTPISTAISWNTTATAPAASSRCAISPRATSSSCSAWSRRRAGGWSRKDDIKRRIDEATKYVALEQLCLSPQCGFASTEEGNVLAEDEQWAKLRMIVELAEEVWGR